MILEFNLSHYIMTAEGVLNSKNRRADEFYGGIFGEETFYISRYIQKHLRTNKKFKEKYKNTPKEDKVTYLVVCINAPKNSTKYFRESRGLSCYLTDKYEEIMPLRSKKRADKVLDIVSKSAKDFEKYIPGIQEAIEEAIGSFKHEDYRNIWIHQKKRIKGIGIAKLVCELSITEFTLDLTVEDKERSIYKKRLIVTMPDSLFYHSMFKTLKVDEKSIIATDRIFEKPFFTISIDDMLQGKEGTFLNPDQELRDKDEKFAKSTIDFTKIPKGIPIKVPNEDPKRWAEFKECLKTIEGTPCPSLK